MTRFEPFLHRLLVRPLELEEVDPIVAAYKKAGLDLPDNVLNAEKHAVVFGIVEAVGQTCFKDYHGDSSWLKPGDKVIYAKHAGASLRDPNDKDKRLLVLNDEDIICVVREE